MSTTRREFFAYSGAAALASALASGLGPQSASARAAAGATTGPKQIKFRGVGGRTGALRGSIGSLATAKKCGLDAIEIEAGGAADKLECSDADAQKEFLAEVEKTGVAMSSICMGLCNSYPVFSEPRAKSWLEQTIDATAALGAKNILVAFFGKGNLKGNAEAKAKTIEVVKSVAERAEQKGVVLGLENTLSAEENIEMVEKIGSPFVRVYYDIGNSAGAGYDVPKEIRMLGTKHINQMHFKDGNALLGQGRINMAAVAKAVIEIGYQGWIILETDAPLGNDLSWAFNAGFVRGLLAV